jgi:multiple sugar transport system permease protein
MKVRLRRGRTDVPPPAREDADMDRSVVDGSAVRPTLREAAAGPPRGLSNTVREALWGYLFILPWIIGFLVFSAGPILATVYLAMTEYNVVEAPRWVGLRNFEDLIFDDPQYIKALLVTVEYSAVRVPLVILFGIGFAMLINTSMRGIAFFRLALYLPSIVPLVAASVLWLWLLNPQFGFVNPWLREGLGVVTPNWLRDEQTALYAIVALSVWQVGHTMMIFLASLQEIPKDLYEAAEIDGASVWQKTWRITIPMITPTIYFNLIMGIISSFQAFAAVFILTRGGPANSTLVYIMYLYRKGVEFLEMGYASAMALILVGIILALTVLIMKTSDRWVNYDRA